MLPKEIQDLKQKIYSRLNDLEDNTALQMLQEAVSEYTAVPNKDILDELTSDQQQRMEASIREINEGKTLSHEEAMQRVKEWLSK